jgi:GMP synthase (glutamine-hydrolysing)
LIIQHVEPEGPGRILGAIHAAGASAHVLRVDRGDAVPRSLSGFDGLVVMGGPMGVGDASRLPHLRDELSLLEHTLGGQAPILGVCLGSQLLAAALGARVYSSGRKEIGWLDVDLTERGRADLAFSGVGARFRPLHWHGDVFDLPSGAVSLARSQMTEHQAFRAGEALGLLFHLEIVDGQVTAMAEAFSEELEGAGVDRVALAASSDDHAARIAPTAALVYGAWAARLRRSTTDS